MRHTMHQQRVNARICGQDFQGVACSRIAREDSLILAAERAAHLAPGWTHVWETARAQTGG